MLQRQCLERTFFYSPFSFARLKRKVVCCTMVLPGRLAVQNVTVSGGAVKEEKVALAWVK